MTRISKENDHAFYVHAGNVHTDELETYGPFPGLPQLTYEFLRDSDGAHLFIFADPTVDDEKLANLHTDRDNPCEAKDHWHDQEGEVRLDGWRRCYEDHPSEGGAGGAFGIPEGPFWTDLSISVVPAGDHEYDPRTYNWHPDEDVRQAYRDRSQPEAVPVGVGGDPGGESIH